jgi:hypothetical protein
MFTAVKMFPKQAAQKSCIPGKQLDHSEPNTHTPDATGAFSDLVFIVIISGNKVSIYGS